MQLFGGGGGGGNVLVTVRLLDIVNDSTTNAKNINDRIAIFTMFTALRLQLLPNVSLGEM